MFVTTLANPYLNIECRVPFKPSALGWRTGIIINRGVPILIELIFCFAVQYYRKTPETFIYKTAFF